MRATAAGIVGPVEQGVGGWVVWITGLSSSGKSAVAAALAEQLNAADARPVVLDGDTMRSLLPQPMGYDLDARQRLATYYADLAGELAAQGHMVIVATISLFRAIHARNRVMLPRYLEVFLDVPAVVRAERDVRGVYATSQSVGVDVPAELPVAPDLTIANHGTLTPPASAALIADLLLQRRHQGP